VKYKFVSLEILMSISRDSALPESARRYRYQLFGLSLESAIAIPGLTETYPQNGACTIQIDFASAPDSISSPDYIDETVQASASEYLFSYPELLRLYVNGDRQIVVERFDECDSARMWTVILGVGSSIIGFRRGFIPLHASAVRGHDGCIALAGQSGFGKSTLAASLARFGFPLHADDLCLIQPGANGALEVGGGVRELRLWDDAVEILDWSAHKPFATVPDMPKSVYRLEQEPVSLLPLRRLYALAFEDESTPSGIYKIKGVEALQTLIGCLRMRPGLLPIGPRQRTFERLAAIGREIEIYRFVRPRDRSQLWAWSERLASHFATHEDQ
jgi:hypothetical protein